MWLKERFSHELTLYKIFVASNVDSAYACMCVSVCVYRIYLHCNIYLCTNTAIPMYTKRNDNLSRILPRPTYQYVRIIEMRENALNYFSPPSVSAYAIFYTIFGSDAEEKKIGNFFVRSL